MAIEFGLKIVSPSTSHESQRSMAITIPGSQGYMTILPGHTAMVAELGIGELLVTDAASQKKSSYFISGGFVEVKGDDVMVLADIVESANKIDLQSAEKNKADALSMLEGKKDADNLQLSSKMLKEAEYRIKIAKSVAN